MNIQAWIFSFRLRTLPLALSCIGMGGFLAASVKAFDTAVFLLCCITTLLLQILSNLANDYGDSIHGADNADRKGPARMVQSGIISPLDMKRAVIVFVLLSFCSGILLLWKAFGNNWEYFVYFFLLGIGSILAAIAYTIGKRPYGYAGLGDLSVLFFFGFVGVLGSFFLLTKTMRWIEILPALSCGFFSMAVLNINNIRDIESDVKAGKNSIPVRVGKRNASIYHILILFFGLASSIGYSILNFRSVEQFIYLAIVPLLVINGIAVYKKESLELDPYLRQMALTTLLFVGLFGIGILIA